MKQVVSFLMFLIYSSLVIGQVSFGEPERINSNWKFNKGDTEQAALESFDDSDWRTVDLPHDWSVEGPYSPHNASATGYLPGGIAWYRKNIEIPESEQGQKVYIYFEGIYRNGEVFINGKSLGIRPNGYISYLYDLTPFLRFGGKNTLAVRVDHSKSIDSRWYTGSGIYRDVYLVYANPVHISQWGVFYQTKMMNKNTSIVNLETSITNTTSQLQTLTVKQELFDNEDQLVASSSGELTVDNGSSGKVNQVLTVKKPSLWSVDNPNLYKLKTTVFNGQEFIDQTTTRVGIRTLDFDSDKGFALNGDNMKVKGVCLHHDAGVLGSAVPEEVWKRRLIKLKELGVNAIRTSHNPQAPVLYDLCDELGLLVLNEAFDEWEFPKGYGFTGPESSIGFYVEHRQ
jgi:beta-galactosidase/beta-glucuronidase